MKTASLKEIKNALSYRSQAELMAICLELGRFKKENKELLTYLLFESGDEEAYIRGVKDLITSDFNEINTESYYFIKKSTRKILRNVNKFIRYSKKKETEVELLLHFCYELKEMHPDYSKNTVLVNMFNRQIIRIEKILGKLHEDLQYDYNIELTMLRKAL